ncbi:hypothetical protein BV22DRAFT_1015792 [Leucogyrophana mollusca]|uniref:Uncharacterized protein n=1 Tax=Leucogyrophana mollusca TaxID=85980 RepID=A0ACB8BC92_9AGAM|nr:hypothetical protein BV22DRAFT_1015792 [Leucogyrophana mollusca]
MPLREVEFPSDPESLKHAKEKYIVFYSSRVDGKMWCPDCVAVEEPVQRIFGDENGPSAVIVYVGQKAEYGSKNPFREEPWKIVSIPTIIRLKDVRFFHR